MKMAENVAKIPAPSTKDKRDFAADVAKAIGVKNSRKGMLARLADKTPRLVSGVYGKTDALSGMMREDFAKRDSRLDGIHLAVYDGLFTGLFARSADAEKKFDYTGFALRRAALYGAEEEGEFARLYQRGFRLAGKVKDLRDKKALAAILNEAEKNLPELTPEDKTFLNDLAQMLSEVL